jgi:anti-anti-sigma factor
MVMAGGTLEAVVDWDESASDELRCLRLSGPLTTSTAREVRDLFAAHPGGGDGRLLVDLQGVTAVDASGVAALLEGQRQVEKAPDGLMLLRANAIVSRALKVSGTIGAFMLWNG